MNVDEHDWAMERYMDQAMDYSPEEQEMDAYEGWSKIDLANEDM